MHEVQTSTRLTVPLTIARTRWMLGFQRRLVRRCEWLMLMPNEGCLPHTSHTDAMTRLPPREIAGGTVKVSIPPDGHARAPGPRRPQSRGHGLPRRAPGPPGAHKPAERLPGP